MTEVSPCRASFEALPGRVSPGWAASLRFGALASRAQAPDVRIDRAREAVEGVTSLEHRHDASARVLSGDLGDDAGEFGKIAVGQSEPAERIAGARVEAGRDHHELGLEALRRRYQPGPKRIENLVAASACRERPVNSAAATLALAGLGRAAGAR